MDNIKQITDTFTANTYARAPIALVSGRGSELFDDTGKRYIDLGTGIAVNVFGAADAAWAQAVSEQLGKIQHTSNIYYNEPSARLAKMLCERTGMKKVFFSNSGAEANECAIKTARLWAYQKYGDESHAAVITLTGSFHGRTLATLAATGQEKFHTKFGPFPAGFAYAQAGDIESLKTIVESVPACAVMLETIQGEGGINVLSTEYLQAAEQLCRENDLLLITDEVQTGNGRTGKLYSYMHHGISPDIVSTAKGLAGGLPMGATLMDERCADTPEPGCHGSTFGGNPAAAAGACSVLERLDDALLAGVAEREALIRETLGGVCEIHGKGLMLGLKCEKAPAGIMQQAAQQGVLVLTAKDKVRLLPALNIPKELLMEALEILKKIIEQKDSGESA